MAGFGFHDGPSKKQEGADDVDLIYSDKLVPHFEIEDRIARLRSAMEDRGFDAALIIHRPNYFYFSGTSQNSMLYVDKRRNPILFVRRDLDRARVESPIANIVGYSSLKQLPHLIGEHLGSLPKTLGIELDVLPALSLFSFEGIFKGVDFVNSFPAIMKCRSKKTPFELAQIKKASRICREVFEAGRTKLRSGMSEIEFAANLELEAKKLGHEGIIRMRGLNLEGYSWHILSGLSGAKVSEADTPSGGQGLSPAFPMGAGHRKIQENEPIFVDFPICYNGYISDQARFSA